MEVRTGIMGVALSRYKPLSSKPDLCRRFMRLTKDVASTGKPEDSVDEHNHPGRSKDGVPVCNGRESKIPHLEAVMNCLADRLMRSPQKYRLSRSVQSSAAADPAVSQRRDLT